MWWRRLAEVQTEHQNGEERGFKWLWTWNGCWCQTGAGFSRTTIFRVYREWSEKEKISSELQLCGRKYLLDVRGQRRMGRLVRDDRDATVTQITTRYNQGMQNTISERTTRWTLKQMGYSSRRPHRVQLLSAKNWKRRLQFTQPHQNWMIEDWKTLPGLMSLDFCCDIQMIGSEFGIKNMKAWIHPASSQRNGVGDIFFGTLWAL